MKRIEFNELNSNVDLLLEEAFDSDVYHRKLLPSQPQQQLTRGKKLFQQVPHYIQEQTRLLL